ncbi:D-alanyl-D-alanine carboxypeptidase family protein [Virgibacillus kekensis]|uniref:D-alanyl-D-alanine carboxypeptidase family protein n=1 Tax=Virgibacillus kekensis TaxID=202261 RepID=A0ABV9DN82_9BACI
MKKYMPAAAALTVILTFTGACSEKPDNQQTVDPAPKNEVNENQNKKEQPKPEVPLPEELLHKTDEGEAVKKLEQALNHIGYSIATDGKFDAETTWAVTDFQMQQEMQMITGIYDESTKQALKKSVENNSAVKPAAALTKPDDNLEIVSNPHEVLVLVNKNHALPEGFVPKNLVVPNVQFPFTEDLPKKQMRQVAAVALEKMFYAANDAGLELYAQSGYRSYERQDSIFASNVRAYGEEAANNFSARPGESEHQTGLTMDVSSRDVGYKLVIEFGETDEGKWLKQHAAEYGFIIRYPKGKENITQYQYEPWHLRYVGPDAAKEIMQKGITLEEYLGAQ